MLSGSDAVSPATTGKTFTDLSQDIDLRTAVPTGGKATGRACRRIRIDTVSGVGALAVQYADGSTHTRPALNAGDQIDAQVVKIFSTSNGTANITSVTVDW